MTARNRHSLVFTAAAVLVSACVQYDRYGNLDATPGETVSASSPIQRNLMLGSNRSDHWTRIRLIAPEGAMSCRIANQSLFDRRGPEMEGSPDAHGAVMLTVSARVRKAEFSCKTPHGVIRRGVNAVPYEIAYTYKDQRRVLSTAQVLSPIIHIDPTDPLAPQRWSDFWNQTCPVISERAATLLCKPGMPEKLQAADLGAP